MSKRSRDASASGENEVDERPAQKIKVEETEDSAVPEEPTDVATLIQNLSDALDAVLKSEATLLHSNTFNRIQIARCRALQPELPPPTKTKVAKKAKKVAEQAAPAPAGKQSEIIPPTNITPFTLSSIPVALPKLPKIKDEHLERAAFTHSGIATGSEAIADSYERLEWVGDVYLELIATLLISKTFDQLMPGRSAQLRERCVKNETLAGFAMRYDFHKRYILPKEFMDLDPKKNTKILGDIFEAYCAAVILSDPEQGIQKISEWLKTLWAGTLKDDIKAHYEKQGVQAPVGPVITTANAKQELSRQLLSRHCRLHYKDIGEPTRDPKTNLLLYTVGVYLEGWGEKNKLLGKGKALAKKEAGAKAAVNALKEDLWEYKEKKRVFDQMARERKEKEEAEKAMKTEDA